MFGRASSRLITASLAALVLHAALLPVVAGMVQSSKTGALPPANPEGLHFRLEADDTTQGGRLSTRLSVTKGSIRENVRFVLSADRRLDPTDTTLGDITLPNLHPGAESPPLNQIWNLPADVQGPVFVAAIQGEHVSERAARANPDAPYGSSKASIAWASAWVEPSHPGRIVLEDLDAPADAEEGSRLDWRVTLTNPTPGWFRGRVILDATLSQTIGSDPADTLWHDDNTALSLAPGASKTLTRSTWLPVGSVGPHRLIVSHFDEHTATEEPKVLRSEIDLRPATTPDLAVGQTWSPPRIAIGVPTRLRAEVWNLSRVAAQPKPRWADFVFISNDPLLDDGDTLVGKRDQTRSLPGATGYDAEFEVTLPDSLWSDEATDDASGRGGQERYLLFVADAAGQVDEAGRESNNLRAAPFTLLNQPVAPTRTGLGRDDAPPRLTVAWISHDAFERLRAENDRAEQPAVQSRVEPTPGAPLHVSAAPAQPSPAAPPSPAGPEQTYKPETTAEASTASTGPGFPSAVPTPAPSRFDWSNRWPGLSQQNRGATLPPRPDVAAASPKSPPDAQPLPLERVTIANEDAVAQESVAESRPPAAEPTDDPDRPTATPRGTADADAASVAPVPLLRPGAVEVSKGLRITTSRPDIAVPTLLTTVPRDTTARLTFDTDGAVIDARLLGSAGSVGLDAPIRAALYRWRASGEQLDEWDAPRTFTFELVWPR